jgi:hypothetical protein
MSGITIPIELELTPRSRAIIDALLQPGMPGHTPQTGTRTAKTTLPAVGKYWPGQGGIYCGVLPAIGDQPAMHMVFSMDETKATWGPYGEEFPGAKSRHDGLTNTKELNASGKEFPAAAWAANYKADGHQDFHLPSQAELFMASLHAPQVFDKEGWYWSSTQSSAYGAFGQVFEYGDSYWSTKDSERRVRAVRWIPL